MSGISGLTYGQNAKLNVSGKDNVKLGSGSTVFGRITKVDSEGNATIKLTNGAEMNAKIEGDIKDIDTAKLIKFKINGVSDNKILLSIDYKGAELIKEENIDEDLMKFMEKHGIKKEDAPILKEMLKHNIPLTKENITMVKSLIEFSNKVSNNPEEIKQFIETYLNGRDIPSGSEQAMVITEKLTEFLEAFSKISKDNILFFIENKIEFTKDNIESFNSLFKGGADITEVLDDIKNQFNNIDADGIGNESDNRLKSEIMKVFKGESENNISEEKPKINLSAREIIKGLAAYKQNDKGIQVIKNNESKLQNTTDIKKEIKAKAESLQQIKNEIKIILDKNNVEISPKEINLIADTIKGYEHNGINTKSDLVNIFKEFISREIEVTNTDLEKLISIIKSEKDNVDLSVKINSLKESISEKVNEKTAEAKENIKSIVNAIKNSEDTSEIISIMKNTINDLKVYNKVSDQYYYLDMPVNYNENEYPCKLIIKDDRRDSKNIDSKSFKIVIGVKTIKMGMIDSFLEVNDKNMNLEIKCEEKYLKIFELSKDRFKEILEKQGFNAIVRITKKIEDAEIDNCREFFGENNIAGIDIKV